MGGSTTAASTEANAPGPASSPSSRPAVSQHLKVLKDAGLVTDRAAGTRRIYRVDPAGIASLRAELDRFWTQALTNFKDIVEHPAEEAP